MKTAHWISALTIGASLCFTGCGGNSEKKTANTGGEKHEEHEGHEHGEGGGGVSFQAGRGLVLSADVIRALGLKTAEAEERPLSAEMKLLAQVFAKTPRVLASASLPDADVERLATQRFTGAKLERFDRTSAAATGRADVILALDRTPVPEPGEFVELILTSEPRATLSIPRSAVLDAATGTFVYVVNGGLYLRTAVKVGIHSGEFVEIVDGLYTGDIVVTTPVNQLWLSELRLTKGGGHSH